jgi:hypothetical protein
MRGLRGCSPRRWWVSGRRGLAGRWWTEVAAGVSRRGSVWSMENGGWDGIGCSGEMGCSWALYIGWGRLSEAAEERSRWRPMEFNGVVVSSLESAPRGRGNGGAAPLWKGKWRRHGSGRGGGAQCDDSRPDGRWRRGIGPEEGDEGGAGRVGCKGRVGRFQKWKTKTKMKMELGWAARDVWAEFKLGH